METSICAISDLHGNLVDNIMPSDILLIAGDISPLWCQSFKTEVDKWIKTKFLRWINSLPVKKVYLIPGNHDFFFENLTEYELSSLKTILAPKCELLLHEFTKYNCEDGTHISIFGTPYCKIFGNWAFMRSFDFLSEKFKEIPDKIDILLCHDAPTNVQDQDAILEYPQFVEHVGNFALEELLSRIDYSWCIHGHIHSSSHIPTPFKTGKVVNTSILNENYHVHYKPFYFKLSSHD